MLAAPLLLGFDHPSFWRAETNTQPARPASPWATLRPLLTGRGTAAVLCMGLGLLREWLMTGSVFAAAVPTVNQTGMPVAVPLGLILAGFLFGLARWTANRIRRWAERGML